MNILFVSHSLTMSGGANRSMIQLILELRKNHGISPVVLSPFGKLEKEDHGLVKECINKSIPVEQSIIPWFLHNKIWFHRFKYILLFFYFPLLILKLKKYNIQLVHSNGSVFDLGARISKFLKVPHVWHLREFGTEDKTFKPVWSEKYIKEAYKKADVFIAISDAIKESYTGRIVEGKVIRIYNGIDGNKYQKQAQHNNERTEFVIVGAVTPHKNQFEAVKAVAELIKKGNTNFHLNIIGSEDKVYRYAMEEFVVNHRISDYITFWGLRNDVPDILSKMDVGLMLSKSEAFGRVTIEYMFQNLAVIATNTGANPELIKDTETGFLYNIGNLIELTNIMEKLVKDRNLLIRTAKSGREYAIQTFPSAINTNNVFNIYKNLEKNGEN